MMKTFPREEGIDHTLTLMREGYQYIQNRRESFQSDVFETRLLGEKVICLSGEEAARIFYDNDKFIRHGAAPKRAQKTLLGENGVQTLDGETHHHRKAMFMTLMSPAGLKKMNELIAVQWEKKIEEWAGQKRVNLYEQAQDILTQAACEWAGVPLEDDEAEEKRKELALLFETPASAGIHYWRGKRARTNLETWIGGLIEQVGAGDLQVPEESALYQFSFHQDLEGNLLDKETAAVEVLNIIRPIVAVSIYIAFLGHAIISHPEEKRKLASRKESALENFVQEVRRLYPFFPFNGARVKVDFEWNGYQFEKGILTLLDFFGTNRDPRSWTNPTLFDPSRFEDETITSYNFMPQGGGDHATGHRCPGEWLTIEVMKISLDYLANRMEFDVPDQDISYSLVSMPSIPNSEIVLENVRRVAK